MINQTLRFTIDRVGDADWQIFSVETMETPIVYFMYAIPVTNGVSNVQLVLTVYDAVKAAGHEYPEFETELYSTSFYAADEEQIEHVVNEICYVLQSTDIDNPVELAHEFGGTVRNNAMRSTVMPDTH